ncbi:MAG: hypothetical protein IKW10_07490 [Oscillospiraceae bacterium]|nr:hypothetical protein [Oscillospiraceae bacterium]
MKKTLLALLLALVVVAGFVLTATPEVSAANDISLLYDDRKDLSELLGVSVTSVKITNQNVTSKAVGSTSKDANVLIYENGVLYAVGTGTATLTVDGNAYAVTVSPAPISLFMVTGHSVGAGQEGTASQSVAVEAGQAYSSYYVKSLDTTKVDGYGLGYGSAKRAGVATSKQYGSTGDLDAFVAGKGGTVGVGSAFAAKWIEQTGEKIWVLNAAVPGSCLNEWKPGHPGHHTGTSAYAYPYYDNAVAMYQCAQKILKNEIAAGHYTLSHMGIVQFVGANFSARYPDFTLDSLLQDYHDLWDGFKAAFTMDVNGDGKTETVEKLALVPFWSASSQNYSGDKAAAYYMSASQEWPDVFIVSDLYRNWVKAAGLSTFPAINYATNSGESVQVPTSVQHTKQDGTSDWSVFCAADKTHLSQVTYNAVGFDIGLNLYNYFYKNISATEAAFKDVSGNDLTTASIGVKNRLSIVPVVKAVSGKNVTLSAEGAVSLNGNCIVGNEVGTGTVKILIGGQVADTLTVTVSNVTHVDHCACGGNANGMKNHTCSTLSGWSAWGDTDAEKTSFPTTAGNYYLVSDITVGTAPTVSANVNLCLNGFNITASVRINVKANISITDCREQNNWGTFKSTKSDKNLGGLFFIYEGSRKVNFYGGNFDASETAIYRGGIAHIGNNSSSNATVNVYAGNFKGANVVAKADGTATARGGLFIVTTGSTLNMYGGTMTGGSTGENGGGIYINSGTTFNMYGGTISGGSSTTDGGIIYNAGTFKMEGGTISGGSAKQGGNVYNAKTMTVSGGTISMGEASTYGGNICVSSAGTTTYTGGTVSGGKAASGGGNICALPGATVNIGQASGKTTKIENGIVGDGTTGNGGNIYCGKNNTTSSAVTVSGGTVTGGKAEKGGNIYAQNNVVISGGTTQNGVAISGGNIYAAGTFSVTGGTISGGQADNGGNIYSIGNSTISGGEIKNGKASGCGGNIYQINDKDVTLTISGGTISGGKTTATTADNKGGNIYIHGENDKEVGNAVINGGTITGGIANLGGNIYNNGTLTINDGLITLGEAKGSGACAGNLYVGMARSTTTKEIYPSVLMTGGTISDGKAASTGGNIQCHAAFTMTGGLISGGKSNSSAGNIRLFRPGTFVLDGGTIDGGAAASNGGVFQVVGNTPTTSYEQTAVLTIKSGTINGGSAKNGGAISLERFGVLNMEGGTINGGTATENGGVIYIYSQYADRDVVANISGGEIINGTAELGDGIYITADADAKVPVLTVSKDASLSGTGENIYVNNASDVQVVFNQLSGADTLITMDAADKAMAFATADADYSGYMQCDDEAYKVSYEDGALFFLEDSSVKVAAVYEGQNELGKYATLEEAIAAAGNGYVKLLVDVETDYVLTGTAWIDLNGFDLTGLTVSGTLYGMDSTTLTYNGENVGVLTATVVDGGQIVEHSKSTSEQVGGIYRYLTIAGEDGTYTFHRFYVGITMMSIAPAQYGIGYKAEFYGDDAVKNALQQTDTFGYQLWIDGYNAVVRDYDADQFGVKTTLTLRVSNFLDPAKDDAFNEERANLKVNATVFITLASGEMIETDVVAYSFKEMTELATNQYEGYTAEKQEALDLLGAQFESLMFQWAIPFIHHAGDGWIGTDSIPDTTGKYYLTQDISVSSTLKIAPDQEVTLCLNGHKITAFSRVYYVSGTLNICDCCHAKPEAEQGAMIGNSTGTMGAILYMYHGGTFNLYSGNLTATKTTYTQGAVIVMGGDADKYDNENDQLQTFNMYGGKIYGGKATSNGGNISSVRPCQINIYGGEISGGTAGEYGGNIYLKGTASNKSVLNIYGGTISSGTSGKNGGNIYGADTCQINIYGGTVENGTTLANGGNIALNCDDLHMEGGVISGGSAVFGGNIFVPDTDNTHLGLNGGIITGGRAETHGGNLYLRSLGKTSTYTFNNVTISDGYAKCDGGNMYIFTDMLYANYTEEEFDVLLNNCTVTGGEAGDMGDSIYVMEADLTISGNSVIRNENGESLFIGTGETVELKDLASGAKIYVSMAVPGTFTADTAYLSNLYADDASMYLEIVDGNIKLIDQTILANVPELNEFSAGWYRGIITPQEPMPLDGMGSNDKRMEKWEIKTQLEAGFTVLADETGIENAIMLVSVDTLFIQKELSDNLSQAISDATGIAKNRIFYSGSHTHSAVDHDAIFEQTRNYLEDFYVYMTDYAVKAVEDLAPATIQTAAIDILDAEGNSLNASRRFIDDDGNAYSSVDNKTTYGDPSGFEREAGSDPEMQVIRFSRTGKDDVVMFNYQGHPFGWNSSTYGRVSAENWKYIREALQDSVDGTVCTFFMGASGNQGHTDTAIRQNMVSAVDPSITSAYVSSSTTDSLIANGKFVASYIKYALEHATEVQPGELKVVNHTVEMEDYYFTSADPYYTGNANDKPDSSAYKAIDFDLNAVLIADSVGFITAPYEMFHDNGIQIKDFAEDLGIATCFVLTNSMGENKYIASYNAFDNDTTDDKYTSFGVRTGRFVWGTAEALIENYADMLAQLKGVATPDTIYKTIHVDVVDQNGNPVQNVMIELIGNGETRNCSNADGTVDYYIYKDGTFGVNVVKCPAGYSYNGGVVEFGDNNSVTITVTAE